MRHDHFMPNSLSTQLTHGECIPVSRAIRLRHPAEHLAERFPGGAQSGKLLKHIRRFRCTIRDLRELVAWLQELGVEHVATESKGVYWKPAWNVLESHFQIVLANAQHIKAVPRTQDGHEGLSVDRGTFATRTRTFKMLASYSNRRM